MVVISSNKKTLNGLSTDSFDELDIDTLSVAGDITCSSLTASSTVTASFLKGNRLDVSGYVIADAIIGNNANISNGIICGSLSTSSLSLSGQLTCNAVNTGSIYSSGSIYTDSSVTCSSLSSTGAVVGDSFTTSGTVTCSSIVADSASISSFPSLDVSGALRASSLSCNSISCNGDVSGTVGTFMFLNCPFAFNLSSGSISNLGVDYLGVNQQANINCDLNVATNANISGTLLAGSTNLDSCNISGSLTAGATTLTSCNVSGTLSTGALTATSIACNGSLNVSGTSNLSTLNLYGTTTIYRPLSSVSTVTFTGSTNVNSLNSSGTVGCNNLNTSGTASLTTANIATLNVSGTSTLQSVNVSSTLISPTLTCTTFNCSGTGTLRNLSISNTSATDEVLISNPNKHPTITLQGTSGQFGYIGFSDYLGATKGSVYASSSKNGVVVDVGSLTSGFLVQKSGSTLVSIDPSGQIVGNNISIGSGKLSSITHVLGEGSSISTAQKKFGNSSLALTRSNRSFLTLKDLSSASLSTQWTLEFFFYASDSSGGILLSLPQDGYLQIQHTSASTSNYIYVNLKNTSATIISVANTTFSLNTWHHLAIVKNSTQYLCFLNGSLFSNTSSSTVFEWDSLSTALTLGAIYKWSLTNATYASPAYNTQWRGYIDEFRISTTARYTSSGFTLPTSAFTSDASTLYLNHFDSSILEATEDDSLVTTRGGFIADISGNVACSSLSIQSGNVQTNGGDVISQYGSLQSGGAFLTTDAKLLIAPKSLVTAQYPLDPSVGYGCYTITSGGWSQTRTSHTIFGADYLLAQGNTAGGNIGNTNCQGVLTVYASNKSTSGVGLGGIMIVDIITVYGNLNIDIGVNRIRKYNMTTFSISNSFTNILITTDSCQIAWKFEGAI